MPAYNKNIGKSWADGSRVSAIAAFLVSCSVWIKTCLLSIKHQLLFLFSSSVAGLHGILFPTFANICSLAVSVTDETMDNTNSNKMKKPALIVVAITTPDHLQNM